MVWDKFRNIKHMEEEAEAYEALERELKAMLEESGVKEDVEPVNEAYVVPSICEIDATMDLLKLCNPEFVNKIEHFENITQEELPDYIFKDLCLRIGEKYIKQCKIQYSFNAAEDNVRFLAVPCDNLKKY